MFSSIKLTSKQNMNNHRCKSVNSLEVREERVWSSSIGKTFVRIFTRDLVSLSLVEVLTS